MRANDFTIRIIGPNPFRPETISWRAAQIAAAMEGCAVAAIIAALAAFTKDVTPKGDGDPARWLTQFAGLESEASGKAMDAWIEIVYHGDVVRSTASFRELVAVE